MIFSKIFVFILSIVAVPLKHENKSEQNSTSVLSKLPDREMNNVKEETVGWRTRIEEDGWLKALRSLSIIEVLTLPK